MGTLHVVPAFVLVMLWGYLQYRLCGRYRIARGGGGPGLSGAPPERLVETGMYAWTRNPMYLGHIIYMIGVGLTFQSLFAAVVAIARTVWFHFRVRRDGIIQGKTNCGCEDAEHKERAEHANEADTCRQHRNDFVCA